ncbi:hypothetical protein B0H21DRAFT_271215 [Amylocystis lapponica]|nr:hypothetical protein B0H21DRAFT_271215 [Amylocystis lapponica]
MSNVSAATPEFDFWEFVSCAKCHLPFVTEQGVSPQIPFWLTECGHVVCNSHLNSDQSCTQCGQRGIQLMPLQLEMDAPMADWFRSVPLALDTLTFSIRIQMETLASLVRHYKGKCLQQRSLLDRLRADLADRSMLKKALDDLRSENDQLRQYLEYCQSSDIPNSNGKRRMLDIHQNHSGSRTNSSPRSIVTPVGPDRLTLPADRQQPNLSSRHVHPPRSDGTRQFQALQDGDPAEHFQQENRPGSSRFAEQYAYAPPQSHQSPSIHMPTLSHAQAAPARQAVVRQSQGEVRDQEAGRTVTMPPPPPTTRDPRQKFTASAQGSTQQGSGQHRNQSTANRMQMPPPPPPQPQRGLFRPPATPQPPALASSSSSRRFVPTPSRPGTTTSSAPGTSNRLLAALRSSGSQRFSSSASSGSGYPVGGPSSQTRSHAASMSMSGGQRMPFVPGGS